MRTCTRNFAWSIGDHVPSHQSMLLHASKKQLNGHLVWLNISWHTYITNVLIDLYNYTYACGCDISLSIYIFFQSAPQTHIVMKTFFLVKNLFRRLGKYGLFSSSKLTKCPHRICEWRKHRRFLDWFFFQILDNFKLSNLNFLSAYRWHFYLFDAYYKHWYVNKITDSEKIFSTTVQSQLEIWTFGNMQDSHSKCFQCLQQFFLRYTKDGNRKYCGNQRGGESERQGEKQTEKRTELQKGSRSHGKHRPCNGHVNDVVSKNKGQNKRNNPSSAARSNTIYETRCEMYNCEPPCGTLFEAPFVILDKNLPSGIIVQQFNDGICSQLFAFIKNTTNVENCTSQQCCWSRFSWPAGKDLGIDLSENQAFGRSEVRIDFRHFAEIINQITIAIKQSILRLVYPNKRTLYWTVKQKSSVHLISLILSHWGPFIGIIVSFDTLHHEKTSQGEIWYVSASCTNYFWDNSNTNLPQIFSDIFSLFHNMIAVWYFFKFKFKFKSPAWTNQCRRNDRSWNIGMCWPRFSVLLEKKPNVSTTWSMWRKTARA